MIKVVYFNQCFSSMASVMQSIKDKNNGTIKVIASSKNPYHAYKNYCDEFIVEDWVETPDHDRSMKNYIDFLLKLCEDKHVDYFFVKKHHKEVLKHQAEFGIIGVHLICEPLGVIESTENKIKVYNRLAKSSLSDLVPKYFNSLSDKSDIDTLLIKEIINNRGKDNYCIKLASDEGGASFRKIIDSPEVYCNLSSFNNSITTSNAINTVIKYGASNLLYMETLDGPEISVDCYNSKQGFIAVCRSKEGRAEKIFYDEEIKKLCFRLYKMFDIRTIFNVQFRYSDGQLKLLEINTRISGGIYYDLAVGLDIIGAELNDIYTMTAKYNINDFVEFKDKVVSHIEAPTIIK